jgi:hypothetical protein
MLGLFLSLAILYVAAAVIGLAIGWQIHARASEGRRREAEREIEQLRLALGEAQVRRARVA